MPTTLITFVGNRDPLGDHNQEGSIVTLVRKLQPDTIVLISTNDEGRRNAVDTQEWLVAEVSIPSEHIFFSHSDGGPNDYRHVLNLAYQTIQKHRQNDVRFVVNSSSGTPQMKTALILLKSMGVMENSEVYQVVDPQYVTEEQPRISTLDVTFIREGVVREKVLTLLVNGDYLTAMNALEELKSVTIHHHVRTSAEWIKQVISGYRYWELVQFDKAAHYFSQAIVNTRKESGEITQLLMAQEKWLKQPELRSSKETEINLFELLHSMDRYVKRERYTDSLARFYRFLEGVIKYDIRLHYEFDPEKIEANKLTSHHRELIKKVAKHDQIPSSLSMYEAMNFLQIINDQRWSNMLNAPWRDTTYQSVQEAIETLKGIRNQSLAAHGMLPVTEKQAKDALHVAGLVLRTILPHATELQSVYPFLPKEFTKMVQHHWAQH